MTKIIKTLKNPKTNLYIDYKNYINSPKLSYYYYQTSTIPKYGNEWFSKDKSKEHNYTNVPFYSHRIIERPDGESNARVPKITSDLFESSLEICGQILDFNNINYTYFLRMNINIVHPQETVVRSIPHKDHEVEHKNLIIYFTDSGGKTFVGDDFHDPKEDDIIIFDGVEHFMETPKEKRRIILVATFV